MSAAAAVLTYCFTRYVWVTKRRSAHTRAVHSNQLAKRDKIPMCWAAVSGSIIFSAVAACLRTGLRSSLSSSMRSLTAPLDSAPICPRAAGSFSAHVFVIVF